MRCPEPEPDDMPDQLLASPQVFVHAWATDLGRIGGIAGDPGKRLQRGREWATQRLTRRANQGHSGIVTKIRKSSDGVSADADERAPACRETCARQDEQRIVAERAAILAHRDTEGADLMMACRIEQARQDCEHGSNEKHRWPPCALVDARFANRRPMILRRCRCARPKWVKPNHKALDVSGKSGAKQHHRRYRKARAGRSAAGFFMSFLNRTAVVHRDATPPTPVAGRRKRAAVRASALLAGMREHAGARRGLKSTTA